MPNLGKFILLHLALENYVLLQIPKKQILLGGGGGGRVILSTTIC